MSESFPIITSNVTDFCPVKSELHSFLPVPQPRLCYASRPATSLTPASSVSVSPTSTLYPPFAASPSLFPSPVTATSLFPPSFTSTLFPKPLTPVSIASVSVGSKHCPHLSGIVDTKTGLDHCLPYPEQIIDCHPVLETNVAHRPILYPYSTSTPAHNLLTHPCELPELSCQCKLFPEAESLENCFPAHCKSSAIRDPTFVTAPQSEIPFCSATSALPVEMNRQGEDNLEDNITEQDLVPLPEMDGYEACYQSPPPSEEEEEKPEAEMARMNSSDAEENSQGDLLDGTCGVPTTNAGQGVADPAYEFELPFTKTTANCSKNQGKVDDTKEHIDNNYYNACKNGNQNNYRGAKNKNKFNKRGGQNNNNGGSNNNNNNNGGGNNNSNNNNNRNNGNKKNRGQNRNNYGSSNNGGAGDHLIIDVPTPNEADHVDAVSLVDPVEGHGRNNDRSGPAPWGIGTAYLFGLESSKKVGAGGGGGGGGGGGNNTTTNNNNKNNNNKNNNNGGGGGGNNNNNSNNNQNKKNDNNNNSNNNGPKPGSGGGGGDLKWDTLSRHLKHLCYSVGLIKRTTPGPGYTLDSLCLQCQHRGLVFFFLLSYLVIACNWYNSEKILCFMNSNAAKPDTSHYKEICLSYVYVEDSKSGSRRYLLFYRYLHYCLLMAAAISYVLRCGYVKKWEDPRLCRLWNDMWKDRENYDSSRWSDSSSRVLQYLQSGQPSILHYYKWMLCHLLANLLDVVLMLYFDFLLQGQFLSLVPDSLFPLHRDPATFTDHLSTLFPPFVDCELTDVHRLTSNSDMSFGCHLTLMELYEKMFVIAWLVLAFHWLWSLLMFVWLAVGLVPYVGKLTFVLSGGLVERRSFRAMCSVMKLCSLGEIHVLYLMKRWMSNVQFIALLDEVVRSRKEELSKRRSQQYNRAMMYAYSKIDQNNTSVEMEAGSHGYRPYTNNTDRLYDTDHE